MQFYGWGTEDVEVQITAMASSGMEATYSMGDDAPLAALSAMPHTLFDYFKQRFAQVTNPPIDPLREGAVMSLAMFIGPRGDPLSLEGQGTKRVKIPSPVLNAAEFDELHQSEGLKFTTLSTLYPLKEAVTVGGLKERIDALCDAAVAAINSGANVINLSDKVDDAPAGTTMVGSSYIPPLLAVASVHHRLIREGLRPDTSIVVTTGQAWVTHHFACLVGFGASAVVPYAAYDAVLNWHGQKRNQNAMERGDIPKLSVEAALKNYRKSVDKGLLKILSKMGISLLTSYQGAQIFESLGIADDVLMDSFRGTPSRVGGLTYDDIAAECAEFSRITFGDEIFQNMVQQVEQDGQDIGATKLFNYGFLNYLKSGDYHHNNQVIHT